MVLGQIADTGGSWICPRTGDRFGPCSPCSFRIAYSGKVRDIYDAGDGRLLMVTSDRISAFDVVMDEPIPDKGRVLTAMSAFWFEQMRDIVDNHLLSTDLADLPEGARDPALAGRVMLCRQAEVLPVECIVRGYLTGSAWKEYRTSGTMHGTPPSGRTPRVGTAS